jgi:transposase
MPIALRGDFDAPSLRAAARQAKDAGQARRLLALAAVYDGATRTEAAKIGGVTLQIVRDWVVKFNAHGPAGLIDRKAPGQPSRLNDTHERRWQRSPRAADPGRSRPCTAWCGGGWSICASGSGRSSGLSSRGKR